MYVCIHTYPIQGTGTTNTIGPLLKAFVRLSHGVVAPRRVWRARTAAHRASVAVPLDLLAGFWTEI